MEVIDKAWHPVRNVYDIYVIGDPSGFYVGQAQRKKLGGWTRRVALHRGGKGGSRAATRLLAANAQVRCIGAIRANRAYVNACEARAWDSRRAAGWIPAHPRPRDGANWAMRAGMIHSSEAKAKIGAASRRWKRSSAYRAKMSVAQRGRKHTLETRVKMKNSAAGKKFTRETRAKMSTSAKIRAKRLETRPPSWKGKHHSLETRAKMRAAQALRRRSELWK